MNLNTEALHIETITERQIEYIMFEKKVRFNLVECTDHGIEHMEDKSSPTTTICDSVDDNETNHLWYQTEDFKKFRAEDKKLMKKYRSLMKQRQRCQVVVGTIEGSNKSIEEYLNQHIELLADDIRGLEDYKSIRANIDFKHRRYACCHAVLKEQVRQQKLFLFQQKRPSTKHLDADDSTAATDIDDDDWSLASTKKFVYDDISIRNCVVSTSMKSKLLAHTLGLSDSAYVRQLNDTNDGCESIADEVVDDNCHRYLGVIDNEETSLFLRRIPPRCSDVDIMTVSPGKLSPRNTTHKTTASSILRSLHLRHLVIPVTQYVSCA